ncbi:MAG: hypothetical protein KC636_01875, partial [Myxococcales bacterium]|nr:hypothetical protein [Myxococcales bacterium]
MKRAPLLLLCSLACAPDTVVATSGGTTDPSGDDSTEGEGDGDGDGDGDGEACERTCEDTECALGVCEGTTCTHVARWACDELDGVFDIRLRFEIAAHEPRLTAYAPGEVLRVYGDESLCDGCPYAAWTVIRDEGGELLAARIDRRPIDADLLTSFGLSEDTWLAPLSRVLVDQDYC